MASKKLQEMVADIQHKYNVTQEDIAKKIGYSRPYLTKAINEGVEGKVLGKLKNAYPDIIQKSTKDDPMIKGEPLKDLIESNKILAVANKTMAETNNELAAMLKAQMSSGNQPSISEQKENDLILEHLAEQGAKAGLWTSKADGLVTLGRFLFSYKRKTALTHK